VTHRERRTGESETGRIGDQGGAGGQKQKAKIKRSGQDDKRERWASAGALPILGFPDRFSDSFYHQAAGILDFIPFHLDYADLFIPM
jgi:hypothetical protein